MADEVVEVEETEEVEAPVFPDNTAEVTFNMINQLITERNDQVAKINAVKGDADNLRKQLEETSTDPRAVEAREARDKAQAALDEALEALHSAVDEEVQSTLRDSDGKAKEIEESIKELDGKIKPATNFFKKMYGENLAKHLHSLERLKGFSTRGAGSSGRRVRGYDAEVVIDGESTTYDNLAGAAKYLGVETSDLQKGFFEAAGNPEQLKDAPDTVEFDFAYTETYDDGTSTDKSAHVVCRREAKEQESSDEDAA